MNTEHLKAVLGYHLTVQLEFPFMAKLKAEYKIQRLYEQVGHNAFMAASYAVLARWEKEKHHE